MRVLAIPDLHEPYAHPQALEFCKKIYREYNCDTVVFLGDEAEFAGLSFHDINPDMPGAKDEYKLTIEALKKWYKTFPNAKVCTSNHTSRPYRKAFKHGIPSAFIKSYHDFLEAPQGWEWADEFIIDDVRYSHGESCKGGVSGLYHSAAKHRRSQVFGHFHSFGGIQYTATDVDIIFGFNVGCVDSETEYFNGKKWVKISDYTLGDKVLQFDTNSRKAELVNPLAYIKLPEDKMYHFENEYGLDQTLCKDHRILFLNSANSFQYKYTSEMIEILTDENKKDSNHRIVPHFNYDGVGLDISDDMLRLQVAFLADGTLQGNRIALRKQRKIDRLRDLLYSTETDFKEVVKENGDIHFYLTGDFIKNIPSDWYYLSQRQLMIVAEEALLWDGDQKSVFSSTNKESIDFFQFAFAANGYRTSISLTNNHIINENSKPCWILIVSKTKKNLTMDHNTKITEVLDHDGFKYCFSVPSGNLVLRRHGSIFTTGNCLIDVKALAFAYAKNFANRPTLGAGVIIDGVPHFIPMDLGKKVIHTDTLESKKINIRTTAIPKTKSYYEGIVDSLKDVGLKPLSERFKEELEKEKSRKINPKDYVDKETLDWAEEAIANSQEYVMIINEKYTLTKDNLGIINNFTGKEYRLKQDGQTAITVVFNFSKVRDVEQERDTVRMSVAGIWTILTLIQKWK